MSTIKVRTETTFSAQLSMENIASEKLHAQANAAIALVSHRPFGQAWLDYREEIGLRHTPAKKNRTDDKHTPPLVPLRYILAFSPPILAAAHSRLANAENGAAMQTAWTKAVMLTLSLWARPFTREGLW